MDHPVVVALHIARHRCAAGSSDVRVFAHTGADHTTFTIPQIQARLVVPA